MLKSKIKIWIEASRLRTLPLAMASIILGSFLAGAAGAFHWGILGLALLTTVLLQILSNLANDYGDAVSGVDSADRIGPTRTVQEGRIQKAEMRKAVIIIGVLSFISGLGLIYLAFGDHWGRILVFLGLGLLAILAAIRYTMGTNPYGYAGLGDLFVYLFFGLTGVAGCYYLYTKVWDPMVLWPASSCGLFATAVLNVNNMRDRISDEKAGKRSIPVRIGHNWAVVYHGFLLAAGFACAVVYIITLQGPMVTWLFVLILPFLLVNFRGVAQLAEDELDPFLRQMAISSLLFSLLFGIGLIL